MHNTIITKKTVTFWNHFKTSHPAAIQLLTFFLISNGVTLFQMVMLPAIRHIFRFTSLTDTAFQILPLGHNPDGSVYYLFNYAAGSIETGGGGGLAYFLSIEVTLLFAQIINFFLQRNVTFKSHSSIIRAAVWYFIAWLIISIGSAALQGLYKTPIYNFFIGLLGETTGMTIADFITVLINCILSFWVFFPIMKIIFRKGNNEK